MSMTTKTGTGGSIPKGRATLWWIIAGVVGLALVVLLAISIAGETPIDEASGYGDPMVQGDSLPVLTPGSQDTAIGLTAPITFGSDWNNNEVNIEADGTSKIIVFLAHWCPHCQADAPRLQAWVNGGNLPSEVELISVATLTDPAHPNWPPQDWLTSIGWTPPVIMDDANNSVASAYGLARTPLWVVLDGNNQVLGRIYGEIRDDGFNALVELAESAP
ncbi:MAG: TlpA disulfide reductase family protein [Acidimicrobiia bacterium]